MFNGLCQSTEMSGRSVEEYLNRADHKLTCGGMEEFLQFYERLDFATLTSKLLRMVCDDSSPIASGTGLFSGQPEIEINLKGGDRLLGAQLSRSDASLFQCEHLRQNH